VRNCTAMFTDALLCTIMVLCKRPMKEGSGPTVMTTQLADAMERGTRVNDSDLYRVLQVDPAAEAEVIEAAYHRLARKYHPDTREVAGDTTPRMQELNLAWTILRDHERRAQYDRARSLSGLAFPAPLATVPVAPMPAPVSAPVPPPRRGLSRRSVAGVMGGALILAGGLGLSGLTAREYLREQAAVVAPPSAPSVETVAGLTQRARLAVGPLAGTLTYGAASGITTVERADANVSVRDFIAEARFFVPYDSRLGQWDCGFLFRNTGVADQYRLIVSSAGRYQLDLWQDGDTTAIAHGAVTELNHDTLGYNDLRLLVDGERTFFYLNGAYVVTLDTARRLISGDVSVATALYNGDALPNRIMRYERFTVLALDPTQPAGNTASSTMG